MSVVLASLTVSTMALALGLAGVRLARSRSSALRHTILVCTLATAGLSPLFELVIPQVPVLPPRDAAVQSTGLMVSSVVAPTAGVTESQRPEPAATSWTVFAVAIGVTTWSAGSLLMLAALITGLVRLRRMTAACTRVSTGPWRESLDLMAAALRLRRRVTLLQSPDPTVLLTCGAWRPYVVLPAGADDWSASRRDVVLAHELAHVRRFDTVVQLASEVVRIAFWFNPLVWRACAHLRLESERACDDAVLRSGVRPADYATHLLDVARHAAGRQRRWVAASAIAHPSTLETRVTAVLNARANREPVTHRVRAAVIVMSLALVSPMAAVSVVPPPNNGDAVGHSDVAARDLSLPSGVITSVAPRLAPVPPAGATGHPPGRAVPEAITASPASVASGLLPPPAPTAAVPVAQQRPGAILGTVVDQTGGVLPGVRVTLISADTGDNVVTTSDAAGKFAFGELISSGYALVAVLPGFANVTQAFKPSGGEVVTRTLLMPLATVEEQISLVGCPGGQAHGGSPGGAPADRPSRWSGASRSLHQAWARLLQAAFPIAHAQVPVRVGGQVRAPRKLLDVKPVCPGIPANVAVPVRVKLFGRIGLDGMIRNLSATPPDWGHIFGQAPDEGVAPPAEFIESALTAARQWRFDPALLNGQPTEVNLVIRFNYR